MTFADTLIDSALAIRRSHSAAPALDVLDLVLAGAGRIEFAADQLQPAGKFGQLVAEAFDRGNTPQEWDAWTRPPADPVLGSSLLTIWREHVLQSFCARYGVSVSD